MAATLQPQRSDTGPNVHVSLYPRALMTELDFKDNRYPSLSSSQHKNPQRASAVVLGTSDRSAWENEGPAPRRSMDPSGSGSLSPGWAPEQRGTQARGADLHSLQSQSQQSQSQEPQRSVLSYALPPGAARRVVERYSLDDNDPRAPSRASGETRPSAVDSTQDIIRSRSGTPQAVRSNAAQERPISFLPSTPRHPSLPAAGIGAGPSSTNNPKFSPPIMPLSASPGYNPPVSPNHRALPQHPTYITPTNAFTPINPVYSKTPQPQEEVCVECAMRDQDMVDVDVTSPGAWERESDAAFEECRQRELEDESKGVVVDDPTRPKIKGGRLTEQNIKMWLSVNPREPASRQQTLNTYIKAQRTLLEAEALAHARAMQEAKQLDSKMRDAYSQLRRSAYDMGSSAAPADDVGGVRIKPPSSPAVNLAHARTHSREITLLENGMIVEHVDVRKEEREARERKRKEERRARKSSRSSGMDVTSIISAQSNSPLTDSGLGLKPYSRYSQTGSARPTSVLTAPLERPELPRAYSQASFSDVHSLGSASPRRTRFFGFKNLSAGWRSQDSLAPSGMSGSMMDMHVALQRETYAQQMSQSPVDLNTPRRSQIWPPTDVEEAITRDTQLEEKPKKKKNGLAKIWRIVTGSSKHENGDTRHASQSYDRNEDDLPLAPPPPLSYLVERGPGDLLTPNGRHVSTPSLPSAPLPKLGQSSPGMSPPTAPSSNLPSPVSSRPSGPDIEVEIRIGGNNEEQDYPPPHPDDALGKSQTPGSRNVHPVTSEPDMRQRHSQSLASSPPPPLPTTRPQPHPALVSRDKSLPPLPGEPRARTLTNAPDSRPRTVYTYDPRQMPPGPGPIHDFLPPKAPFRGQADTRRQSFGGLSSRPNLALHTMPASPKLAIQDPRKLLGPRYDEFGFSRRSLGRIDLMQDSLSHGSPISSTKRKSRFKFSTLLGKKSAPHDQSGGVARQFPAIRQSGSDGQEDVDYATSTSRHSALSAGIPATRMSVTSRKALEDLVAQDADFVAYRYPSNDQRLDLLR